MTDYRALCAELVAALDPKVVGKDGYGPIAALLPRARAALAQPDPISELVSQCRPLEPEMAEHLTPQARWRLYGDEPQPDPAVVPVVVSDALIKAECALSDVAEGEPECDDGDPAQWAEQRCAETLAIIRPVMKLHKIRTSEWPPQPMPTPANNTSEENFND